MSASQALALVRNVGTVRERQQALYYVTYGHTAELLELVARITGAATNEPARARSLRAS